MADSAYVPRLSSAVLGNATPATTIPARHSGVVRVTHWITTVCFFALLVTGIEILISHPRFYWGEDGNSLSASLFDIPIPASRGHVKTGYSYVLPDQNGWSRYLHFQAGWLLVFTGLLYAIHGLLTRHFRKNLIPAGADLSWPAISGVIRKHLRFETSSEEEARSYNVLQRLSYLAVIFVLVPLMIWTGLAMSPAFTAGFPFIVDVFGGFQSARTIHFFVTLMLVLFVVAHVAMVFVSGFRLRMRSMITGREGLHKEHS